MRAEKAGRRPPILPAARCRAARYVILPDQSLCHGPGVWSNPYCEWPIERSVREFNQSSQEFNNRQGGGHQGGGRRR